MKKKHNSSKKHKRIFTKKHKKTKIQTYKRRSNRGGSGMRGGLLGAINSGSITNKPNADNKSYITTVHNSKYTKSYNLEYIIPINMIFLKDPNSTITPEFFIKYGNDGIKDKYTIMIENKFIDYFICIDGVLYAMRRIFGIVNTEYFATLTNIIFYKLNGININLENNDITIPTEQGIIIERNNLSFIQKWFHSTQSKTLQLNTSSYTPITDKDGEIYYVLRQFRNEQILNNYVKEEIVNEGVNGFFDIFFGAIGP